MLAGCASKSPVIIASASHKAQQEATRYQVPRNIYTSYTAPKIGTAQPSLTTPSLPKVIDYQQPMVIAKAPKLYPSVTKPYTKVSAPSYSNLANTDNQTSAGNPSSYTLLGKQYKVLPFSNGFVERGIASWYGPDFHGKKTSNGEVYNMYGMTAAHKRLPIPSYVRVTNLKNHRQVILRINDRGPFHNERVIDLSYAAAQKLDVHEPGTEWVQIEAINSVKGKNHESIYLQLGVFNNPVNAQNLQAKVTANQMPQPRIKQVYHEGRVVYKVQLGPLYSTAKVDEFNMRLARIGVDKTRYVTETKH